MSEDTRKDPRTKFVSLNVRFKSATVDEFIENHSYDVSKGGIFIKTNSPFASGTLLKFEIRLAADEPVIAGVGRVVWKREAAQSGAERPAGMGVKFIKVDDASKAVIDRLVNAHADAGAAFEGGESGTKKPEAPQAPTPVAATSPVAVKPMGGPVVKRTMMGLGATPAATKSPTTTPMSKTVPQSPAAKAEPKKDFFPKTNSEADMPPPEERTVMKQAAELLEEALKEAGGSMDEVGKYAPPPKAAEPEPPPPAAEEPLPPEAKPEPVAAAAAEEETPPPAAAAEEKRKQPSIRPAAERAKVVSATDELDTPKKKGSGAIVWAGLVVLVGGGLFAAYKMNVFGTTTTTAPPATESAPTMPPSASAAPSVPDSASEAPSGSIAVPTMSADASMADASVADAAIRPAVTATVPTVTATARPTATATTTTTATATATATATGTTAPTATGIPSASSTATTPKPKPTSTDDNPY